MEAVVFDGKTLSLKHERAYPVPRVQDPEDVIVRVEYSGVCGTDLHIIQGEFPASKERPLPLGHEFSGVVHEVGARAGFRKGQKVVVDPNRSCQICKFCRKGSYQHCSQASPVGIWRDGGWAQFVRVPQDQVFQLPDSITTEQGALCEPFSCIVHGLARSSPIEIGARILILGSGLIGKLWMSALHHQGHKDVTIAGRNVAKLEVFKRMETGFRLVTPNVLAEESYSYDVIFDCTGSIQAMESSINYMRPGGKYVVFGCCPSNHMAKINALDITEKELTIIGVKINPFSFPQAIQMFEVMGDRYIDYEKLGVKTYALSEYQSLIRDVKNGSVVKGIFKID